MTQFKHGTKLFDLADIKRCNIEMSPDAKDFLLQGHAQSRILPQALQEAFGAYEHVEKVIINLVPKLQHFSVGDEDRDWRLLEIIVKHRYNDDKEHRYYVNAESVQELHPDTHPNPAMRRMPRIQAVKVASQLFHQYPHKEG